jgi:hypothetical protein
LDFCYYLVGNRKIDEIQVGNPICLIFTSRNKTKQKNKQKTNWKFSFNEIE